MNFFAVIGLYLCSLAFADVSSKNAWLTSGSPSEFSSDGIEIDSRNITLTSHGWTEFKQCDSRWSSQQLGTCSHTICSAGCAMSSVAMILATKGAGQNPSTFDSWLTKNGGYANGCEIYWGKADAFGKTTYQGMETANESEICSGLAKGHGIVANVNGGGHWVLLTACAGNGVFYVNDPGYSRTTYSMSEILREAVYH